jgi:hypothetical protein
MRRIIFWNVSQCSAREIEDVSKEGTASISKVEVEGKPTAREIKAEGSVY